MLATRLGTAFLLGAVVAAGYADTVEAQVPAPAAGANPAAAPAPPTGVVVDTFIVRGNQRIEAANIRVVSSLPPSGSSVTNEQIETAIRRLMETNQFEWVDIYAGQQPDGS